MTTTLDTTLKKIFVNSQEAGELLSCSRRTIAAIPEDLLPKCRLGRSVRYRVVDLEALAEKIANGQVSIGSVN